MRGRRAILGISLLAALIAAVFLFAPKWPLVLEDIWLDQQLGLQASDSFQAGYSANMFGGFDKTATRDRMLDVERRLVALDPSDTHFRYVFAGSLMRALRLNEAEEMYRALIAEDPENSAASLTMLATVLWLKNDAAGAQAALDKANEINRRLGLPPTGPSAERAFGALRRGA